MADVGKSRFGNQPSRFAKSPAHPTRVDKTNIGGERTMRFDLLSLKLFVSVCEQRSISRTADLEHIAASAVSKRISDLEQSVKTPLFHRSQRGLEMTSAAHTLLNHARIVLRDLTQLETEMLDQAQGTRGEVRVHASLAAIVEHVPGDLASFMARHPAVRVSIEEAFSSDVVEAVSENAADIGIFGGSLPVGGLHVRPYRSDKLVVVMPKHHPLSGARSLTFAELAEHDLVGPKKGSFLDGILSRAAAELPEPLKVRIRVNGFEPAARMVEAGLGLSVISEYHATRYAATGALVAATLEEPWAVRHFRICSREPRTLPAPVRLLLDHLATHAPALNGPKLPGSPRVVPMMPYVVASTRGRADAAPLNSGRLQRK